MRILLATDAWEPQVNGVVRTLTRTVEECRALGHQVEVITPDQFRRAGARALPCFARLCDAQEHGGRGTIGGLRHSLELPSAGSALFYRVLSIPDQLSSARYAYRRPAAQKINAC